MTNDEFEQKLTDGIEAMKALPLPLRLKMFYLLEGIIQEIDQIRSAKQKDKA